MNNCPKYKKGMPKYDLVGGRRPPIPPKNKNLKIKIRDTQKVGKVQIGREKIILTPLGAIFQCCLGCVFLAGRRSRPAKK